SRMRICADLRLNTTIGNGGKLNVIIGFIGLPRCDSFSQSPTVALEVDLVSKLLQSVQNGSARPLGILLCGDLVSVVLRMGDNRSNSFCINQASKLGQTCLESCGCGVVERYQGLFGRVHCCTEFFALTRPSAELGRLNHKGVQFQIEVTIVLG